MQAKLDPGLTLLVQDRQEAWPFYAQDEVSAAVDVLTSGRVNQWTGHCVRSFERAYQEAVGGHAIALANGSLALEIALRAFGIGPGDEVVVTPRSFVASASCVRLVGATPVFADIDPKSGNITAETIASVLTPRTKAVIPVHLGGWPADMPAIMALAEEKAFKVIEDCAQAHGAVVGDRPVGSFGHAAAFSFCQDKIITTGGEGGLVIFQDEDSYDWAWSFKDHGKSRQKVMTSSGQPGEFKWLHDQVGTNWRMLEISAAIGLRQLTKLPEWRRLRSRNARILADALRDVPGIVCWMPPDGVTHAYYKFYSYLDPVPDVRSRRSRIIARLGEEGVKAFTGSCSEVYLEKAFEDLGIESLPIARQLGATSLMFEVHPTLDPHLLSERAAVAADVIAEEMRR